MKKKTIKAKLAKTEKKLAKTKTKLSAAKSALAASKKDKPAVGKATQKASAKGPAVKKPAVKRPTAKRKPLQKKSPFPKPVPVSLSELLPDSNGTSAENEMNELPETPDNGQAAAA